QISVPEFGAGALTNDQGLFRVSLPSGAHPGQEITIRQDRKDYAICSPLFGKQLIPADLTRPVPIRMLPLSSKLFWTHERIEAFSTRTADESARKPRERRSGETDLSSYLDELGRHYGFTQEEIKREIGKWIETARQDQADFHKLGMAAFAEKRFHLAGENFG